MSKIFLVPDLSSVDLSVMSIFESAVKSLKDLIEKLSSPFGILE
jgi:hypothetical protein